MKEARQHSISRRRVIAGIGVAGSVALLAACGGATTGGETQPAAAKKDVIIKVTARLTNEADMWPIRVPQFHEKYPNVTIQPDLHAGDIQEKIATLIASGDIGDVVHTHFSAAQPQRLYLGKSMRELDSLMTRDKLDLKQWYPQAIDAGRVDNKVIALPFKGKMATVALFYNQTLFEQAGLKPPDLNTSLNDLVDMAVKLTKPDGSQWGLGGFMPDVARNVTGAVRRWNGELFNKDQTKATLDTNEVRAAFTWYYDAINRRKFMTVNDDQKLFQQGKVAMQIHRDYNEKTVNYPAAQTLGFKLGATMIPKGPTGRRGGVWVPDGMQISSISKNMDEAYLAFKWFTDHDTGLALALQKSQGVSTTPGGRPDVYNDPQFLNNEVYPKIFQELDRDSNQLPENYQGQIAANYRLPDVDAILKQAMTAVAKNEAEPTASFLKQLNDDVQKVLDQPRA